MNILNKIGNNLWKSNSSIYSSLIKKTSVITLSVGIFSILISSSVLDGFQFSIKEKIFDFSGHLNISNFGNGLSFKNYPIDTNSGIGSNYQEVNEIEDALPFVLLSALIEKNNNLLNNLKRGRPNFFEPDLENQLKKNIKNSRLEIFKDCAHNVHLEQPDQFNNLVQKFISE